MCYYKGESASPSTSAFVAVHRSSLEDDLINFGPGFLDNGIRNPSTAARNRQTAITIQSVPIHLVFGFKCLNIVNRATWSLGKYCGMGYCWLLRILLEHTFGRAASGQEERDWAEERAQSRATTVSERRSCTSSLNIDRCVTFDLSFKLLGLPCSGCQCSCSKSPRERACHGQNNSIQNIVPRYYLVNALTLWLQSFPSIPHWIRQLNSPSTWWFFLKTRSIEIEGCKIISCAPCG